MKQFNILAKDQSDAMKLCLVRLEAKVLNLSDKPVIYSGSDEMFKDRAPAILNISIVPEGKDHDLTSIPALETIRAAGLARFECEFQYKSYRDTVLNTKLDTFASDLEDSKKMCALAAKQNLNVNSIVRPTIKQLPNEEPNAQPKKIPALKVETFKRLDK